MTQSYKVIIKLIVAWFCTGVTLFCIGTIVPLLLARQNISLGATSVIAALPYVGIFVACLSIAEVLQRASSILINKISCVVLVIGIACCLFGRTIGVFALGMFLVGIGTGYRWIIGDAWITERAAKARGRVIGVYEAVSGSTLFFGPSLASLLIDTPYTCFTWCLVLVLATMVLSWNTPEYAVIHERSSTISKLSLFHEAKNNPRAFLASCVGGFFESGSGVVLALWLTQTNLLTLSQAAVLITGIGVGSLLFQLPLGICSERYTTHRTQIVCSYLIPLAGILLLVATAAPFAISFITAFAWGAFGGGLYTLSAINLGDNLRGNQLIVGLSGAVCAYTIGSSAAPLIGGLVLSYSSSMIFPLTFVLIGMLSSIAIRRV